MKYYKGKQELLNFIKRESRLPEFNELLDIYTDNVLKSQRECWLTVSGQRSSDKPMWKIIESARAWFRYTIGQIVIEGELSVYYPNKEEAKQ